MESDLCRTGCGFHGSQYTDGLCSKCYKEQTPKMTPSTKTLISGVRKGNIGRVTKALDEGADISVVLPKYRGCPHVNLVCVAAIRGHAEIIAKLHYNKAELNFFTKVGFNPLHLAVINNHPNVLRKLVNLGMDPNSTTNNKHAATALHIASRLGLVKCTEQLIALGASVNSRDKNQLTPLMRASECNKVDCIKVLLSNGGDTSATTDAGWDVGHIVARKGSSDVFNYLLKRGHNLKKINHRGLTSINIADEYGHPHIYERIFDSDLIEAVAAGDQKATDEALARGADVLFILSEYKHMHNVNLICIAAIEGHADVIKLLQSYGANLKHSSKAGFNALHFAAYHCHLQVLNVLVDLDVDVKAPTEDEHGLTALHIAAKQGHQIFVEQLIEKGVQPNTRDSAFVASTPVMLAARKNKVKCMEMLIDKGADASLIDSYGMGAAHYAAKEGSYEALKFLVIAGINVHKQDGEGYTPQDWAELTGGRDVVDWLRKVDRPKEVMDRQEEHMHIPQEAPHRPKESAVLPPKDTHLLTESRANYEQLGKCIINRICLGLRLDTSYIKDGHFQDEKGWTLLHHAADTNNESEARILLDNNLVSAYVIAYDQSTPADVAKKNNHHNLARMLTNYRNQRDYSIVEIMAQDLLEKHNMQHAQEQEENKPNAIEILTDSIKNTIYKKNKVEDHDLYQLLLYKISKEDNIEDVVKLLNIGCPVTPVRNFDVHALRLAIDLDRPRITTALLAVGADVFFRSYDCDLLKYTWKSTEPTICLKMIITRMYEHRMRLEKKNLKHKPNLDRILEKILLSMKDKPENSDDRLRKVKYKDNSKKYTCKELTNLLCEAVDNNCPFLISFLRNAGARAYHLSQSGKNAIHHSLDSKTELEEMLVTHIGGSLFVANSEGKTPADGMQNIMKIKLEEIMAISEFTKLENSLSSARGNETSQIKQIALLFACLYASYGKYEDETVSWKELYTYSLELLSGTKDEKEELDSSENITSVDDDFYKKDDRLTWVYRLCQKIAQDVEYNELIDHQEYERMSLPELIDCLNHLKKKITRISEETIKIQVKKEEIDLPIMNCDNILKDALGYTCKKKLDLFLHMLICQAKVNPENYLDDMLKTRPLHYAAANGIQSTVAYLIRTCGVDRYASDNNRNNAAHYAYMNGKIETGDYLIDVEEKLKRETNSSGRTPYDLYKAFNSRVEKLKPKSIPEEHKSEWKQKLQVVCEQNNEKELTKIQMDLCRLRRKIEHSTFKDLALNQLVDYCEGENNTIYKEVVNFIKQVCKDIGQKNQYFQGKLIPAGSAADGVRLKEPEESDFNLVLDWEDVTAKLEELPNDQQEWKGYNKKIVLHSDNPNIKHLISGSNLIDEFFSAVKEAIPKFLNFRDKRLSLVLPGVKKRAVGVGLTLAWMGTDHKLLLVDVDLVPVIKTARPPGYEHPVLTEHLLNCPQSVDHTIEIAGMKWKFSFEDLHAAYINSIGNNSWRFSQALEENYIMHNLSKDKRSIFLISKYIVSALKPEEWYPDRYKEQYRYFSSKFFMLPAPQGFLLKTAFFIELQRISEEKYWDQRYYLDRVKSIFLHMCKQTEDRDFLLESLLPNKELKVNTIVLKCGKLPAYFAKCTQKPCAGYLAATILEAFNTMDKSDFVS